MSFKKENSCKCGLIYLRLWAYKTYAVKLKGRTTESWICMCVCVRGLVTEGKKLSWLCHAVIRRPTRRDSGSAPHRSCSSCYSVCVCVCQLPVSELGTVPCPGQPYADGGVCEAFALKKLVSSPSSEPVSLLLFSLAALFLPSHKSTGCLNSITAASSPQAITDFFSQLMCVIYSTFYRKISTRHISSLLI